MNYLKGGTKMKRVNTKKCIPQHTFAVFTRSAYVFAVCLGAMMVFTCALVSSSSAYFERPKDVIEKSCGEKNTAGGKILVAYDTKYGSTATVAEKIGDTLCEEGFQVDIRLARRVRKRDLADYDGVVAGSAIIIEEWLPGTLKFLEKNESVLAGMPVAYFVVCGLRIIYEGITSEEIEENRIAAIEHYIQPILDEFSEIVPVVDAGLLAGMIDYDKMYPLDYWAMKEFFGDHPVYGQEYYDGRDWDAIATWAREVGAMME